jgi:hypothetical protein
LLELSMMLARELYTELNRVAMAGILSP